MSDTGNAGFHQTGNALSQAAEHVRGARQEVTGLCQGLSSQIQGLGARWGGQGATAFHTLHDTWQEKQRTIVNALDTFAESLETTQSDTVTTDQSQADLSATLLRRLG